MPLKTPERLDLLDTMTDGLGRCVPVGQSYYQETFLPAKYRNNLLLARWGAREMTRFPIENRGASFKATEQHFLDARGKRGRWACASAAAAECSSPSPT